MAGPNSVPMRDKAFAEKLRTLRCTAHGEYCLGGKDNCVMVTLREWLLRRNRLVTGKTR